MLRKSVLPVGTLSRTAATLVLAISVLAPEASSSAVQGDAFELVFLQKSEQQFQFGFCDNLPDNKGSGYVTARVSDPSGRVLKNFYWRYDYSPNVVVNDAHLAPCRNRQSPYQRYWGGGNVDSADGV